MGEVQRRCLGGMALVAIATLAFAQSPAPTLTKTQRTALQVLVKAVDSGAALVDTSEDSWPVHLLRASDGSHYVAFSLNNIEGAAADRPVIVYVRLATRSGVERTVMAERSAVAEWLAGQTPAPVLPRRGLAFGEMPTYGAGGVASRGGATVAQNLQLLELERERARQKRDEQERARKAALEGAESARAARPLLPFEDFDLEARVAPDANGGFVLRRSLTAGPGDYDLTVAWTDTSTAGGAPQVRRRRLTLPAATTSGLALSSAIVADDVRVRETAMPPAEQARNPYSIGATEITPARDHLLSPDERLAVVVQVINARGTPAGKPDVEVGFRVFRRNGGREENIGSLAPQQYNELTLPLDFDVAKGHPIFAAVAVPLRAFRRGDYRMEIGATDRVAGTGVTTDVSFTVTTTPAALLAEAPPLAPAFDPRNENVPAAVPVMLGAIRASEGNDREAIVAWRAALAKEVEPALVRALIVDALLRMKDATNAAAEAQAALSAEPGQPRATRQLARALLMSERHAEALALLDAHLERQSQDHEAQWLALHALYASRLAGQAPGATAAGRHRILELATRYEDAGGRHASLAREWANSVR